jgi:hypothetical protein
MDENFFTQDKIKKLVNDWATENNINFDVTDFEEWLDNYSIKPYSVFVVPKQHIDINHKDFGYDQMKDHAIARYEVDEMNDATTTANTVKHAYKDCYIFITDETEAMILEWIESTRINLFL